MFVHIVLFKWKEDAPKYEIDKIFDELKSLRNMVPGLVGLRCGENFSEYNHEYTHGLVVSFKDLKSLEDYKKNADHLKIVKKIIKYEADSLAIDFQDHS